MLLCKGADSCIFSVLATGQTNDQTKIIQATQTHIDQFAHAGLRTLSFAYRRLSEEDYMVWQEAHMTASLSMKNREEMLMASYNAIETDLTLLGATGIEDKLQDGVPEAIESLRFANIKVWVLTGDKQETAIEIAKSCKLITPSMSVVLLNSGACAMPFNKLDLAAKERHDSAAEDELGGLLAVV